MRRQHRAKKTGVGRLFLLLAEMVLLTQVVSLLSKSDATSGRSSSWLPVGALRVAHDSIILASTPPPVVP